MAEEVAEHGCIFKCLLESTNRVKLNKLKLEKAAKLHTAHPCFYCRRYELNLKSNSEDTTAKNVAGVRDYWGLLTPFLLSLSDADKLLV